MIGSLQHAELIKTSRTGCLIFAGYLIKAPVAQLDRVIGFEPIGREFESLRARHY